MITSLIIIVILSSALFYTVINPIYLPIEVVTALENFFSNLYKWDDILPISALVDDFTAFVYILSAFFIVKIFLRLLGLVSSGQGDVVD